MSYYWNHCCLYCRFVMTMLISVQSLMEIIVVLVKQAGMEDDVIKI